MERNIFNYFFGAISILIGLFLAISDIREFIILEFYTPVTTAYLGAIPLMTRISQWTYYLLLAVSGLYLVLKKYQSWHFYQLTSVLIITERLLVFFVFQDLFYGKIVPNLIVPMASGIALLMITNLKVLSKNFGLTDKKSKWWLTSFYIGIFMTVVPKLSYILDTLAFW